MRLPFVIDRGDRKCLVDQAVDGIKAAIIGGRFKVGELVPSLNEFAKAANVSLKVPYTAYARLADDGWLVPRRGVGFAAASPRIPVWKGRILLIDTNSGYYGTELSRRLQCRLERSGYLVEHAVTLKDGRGAWMLGTLDAMLATSHDFIICREHDRTVCSKVAEAATPYITVFTANEPKWMPDDAWFRGCIAADLSAVDGMVRAVRRAGIRKVVWLDINDVHYRYASALAEAGCTVESWRVPRTFKVETEESVRMASLQFVRNRLRRNPLPDLFLITDDHVADGAFYAMAQAGIRVPDDVRVIAQYCPGFGLGYMTGFARLIWDPDEHSARIAEFVVDQIAGGGRKKLPSLSPRFSRGTAL